MNLGAFLLDLREFSIGNLLWKTAASALPHKKRCAFSHFCIFLLLCRLRSVGFFLVAYFLSPFPLKGQEKEKYTSQLSGLIA